MKSLDDVICERSAAKALERGRQAAESAFLEFHGKWSDEATVAAVAFFRNRMIKPGSTALPSLIEAQALMIEAFDLRLRELIAKGQSSSGNG